jgi:hypothetical protein
MAPPLVTRRQALRGAGALVFLPFLEKLAPAAPAAKPPLRFGIVTVAGGTVIESWKPKGAGPIGKLPSILRPLEGVKDNILIVSGLSHNGQSQNLNNHEQCALLHLTGAPHVKKVDGRMVAGVSVDQAAARVLGDETHLPSLELGLTNGETRFSFRAPDAQMPFEANPRHVFDRMFRGRKPVVPNWSRRAAAAATRPQAARGDTPERAVVDLVREQADDLRNTLGGSDRRRLDEYLYAVRAIEKRIVAAERRQVIEALDAADPGPSRLTLPKNLPAADMPIWAITKPVHDDPERHADYIRLMSDLFVLAFQTDSTRVATLAIGSDEAMFPGVVTVGYERHGHTLEHQGNAGRVEDADPIAREACRQIHAWYTALFAETVRKMRAIDEGGTSLLDNSALLYTSYMADGGHGMRDYPVLLAGKAGGALKPGRHVAAKADTSVANLYVELLNRLGVPTDRFGNSTGRLAGLA